MSLFSTQIPSCVRIATAFGALYGARLGAARHFACKEIYPCGPNTLATRICKNHRTPAIFGQGTGPTPLRVSVITAGSALGVLATATAAIAFHRFFPATLGIVESKLHGTAIPTLLFWSAMAFIPKAVSNGLRVCHPHRTAKQIEPGFIRSFLEFFTFLGREVK